MILEGLIRSLAYATKDWPDNIAEIEKMAGEEGEEAARDAVLLRDRLLKDLQGFHWSSEVQWDPGRELDPRRGMFGNEY